MLLHLLPKLRGGQGLCGCSNNATTYQQQCTSAQSAAATASITQTSKMPSTNKVLQIGQPVALKDSSYLARVPNLHQVSPVETLFLLQGDKVDLLRRESFVCEGSLHSRTYAVA